MKFLKRRFAAAPEGTADARLPVDYGRRDYMTTKEIQHRGGQRCCRHRKRD